MTRHERLLEERRRMQGIVKVSVELLTAEIGRIDPRRSDPNTIDLLTQVRDNLAVYLDQDPVRERVDALDEKACRNLIGDIARAMEDEELSWDKTLKAIRTRLENDGILDRPRLDVIA